MKKFLLKLLGKLWRWGLVGVLIGLTFGITFNVVRTHYARVNELATLTSAFNQQYGTDGITVKQMASPDKVYVAVWTSKDGATHVSWNMGGLWVTVWNGTVPAVTTP